MPSGGAHHRYDDGLRATIVEQLEAGIPCNKIAWFNRVSTSFVSQLNVRRRIPPEAAEKNKKPRGPSAKISREAHEAMLRFVDGRCHGGTAPACTNGEVVEFLRTTFAIDVSEPTVSRALKRSRVERQRETERERENEAKRAREREVAERERDARLRAEVGALVAAGSTVDEFRAAVEGLVKERAGS